MSMHFALPTFPRCLRPQERVAIESQIEALIALLDEDDGDCDIEQDDDSGGNVLDEEHDLHENLIPIYGIDQAAGPTNEFEAKRAYRRAKGWEL